MGDIKPISARNFISQMNEILKEERENRTSEKHYIDISKITPDCDLIKSIIALHKKCKLKHKEGCFADTCEECLARTFNGYHNHFLPLVKSPKQESLFDGGDME